MKFKRNIDQAMDAIEHINLIKLNDNLAARAGEPLSEPLQIIVVAGSTVSDPGVPGVKLEVGYKALHKPSGRLRPKSAEIKTDQDGVAGFDHPVPEFVGTSDVRIYLDLRAKLEGLESARGSRQDLVDGLESLILNKSVAYKITVTSGAKSIKTGVLLVDYDAEGGIAGTTESSSALKSALSGFNLTTLRAAASELDGRDESEIVSLLKAQHADRVERILFGTVRIVETSQRYGRTVAKAAGSVQVIDVASGEILYSGQKEKSGMGRDEKSATASAFKEMGKLLGGEIKNNLP